MLHIPIPEHIRNNIWSFRALKEWSDYWEKLSEEDKALEIVYIQSMSIIHRWNDKYKSF